MRKLILMGATIGIVLGRVRIQYLGPCFACLLLVAAVLTIGAVSAPTARAADPGKCSGTHDYCTDANGQFETVYHWPGDDGAPAGVCTSTVQVDWGDGHKASLTHITGQDNHVAHDYAHPGVYTVDVLSTPNGPSSDPDWECFTVAFKKTIEYPDPCADVDFQSIFSDPRLSDFAYESTVPVGSEFPFSVAVIPKISVDAKVCPGDDHPALAPNSPVSFLNWHGAFFSLADFSWHKAPFGQASIFSGYSLGADASSGVRAPIVEAAGGGRFAFPIASLDISPLTFDFPPLHTGSSAVRLAAGAELDLNFYPNDAVIWLGRKLLEFEGSALLAEGTGGLAAPYLAAASGLRLAYEAAVAAARITNTYSRVTRAWNLGVGSVPYVLLIKQILQAEVPGLVPQVRAYAAEQLKAARKFVTGALAGVFRRRTAAQLPTTVGVPGGRALAAADAAPVAPIDSTDLVELSATPLRRAKGLHGRKHIGQRQARQLAQELVKYGFTRVAAHPLLTTRKSVRVGRSFGVAGSHLPKTGLATLELRGPNYSAQRLIGTKHGVAAARIKLPQDAEPGRWRVGILDYSKADQGGKVVMDATAIKVRPRGK